MLMLLAGYVAGAVSAVVSPKLFRWVADKVAEAKARIGK